MESQRHQLGESGIATGISPQTVIPDLSSPNIRLGKPDNNGYKFSHRYNGTAVDSKEKTHSAQIEEINSWIVENFATPQQLEQYLQGNAKAVDPNIHNEAKRLEGMNEEFMQRARSFDAHVGLEHTNRLLTTADQQVESLFFSNDVRAATRIAQFKEIHLISDVDNTITDHEGRSTVDTFKSLFPASVFVEPILQKYGRREGVFSLLFAATWQQALRRFPEVFENASEFIPLRKGVNECFEYLIATGIEVSVISGNFTPFIDRVLQRIPSAKDFNLSLSVPPDGPTITSIEKGVIIQHLIAQNPEKAIIYCGDGESDWPAIEAKDYIAVYFALQNSSFAQRLKAAGALHFTYRDFHDIQSQIEGIQSLTPQLLNH